MSMSRLARQGYTTGPPGAQPETVETLLTLAQPWLTRLKLSEVGASSAAKQRRRQHRADAVLQAGATGFGAGSPGAELGHHTVPGAGDEASLLQPRLGLKVLAYGVLSRCRVSLLDTCHLTGLDALLAPSAHAGGHHRGIALCTGATTHGHGYTLVPGAQLPVVHVLVPVAHAEAALLVVGAGGLLAVGVQGGPAFGVGTPHRPALAAPWATLVAHTAAPWPCAKTHTQYASVHRNGESMRFRGTFNVNYMVWLK